MVERGSITKRSLSDVARGLPSAEESIAVSDRLDSPVTSMRVIPCADRLYLAAGDEDGVLRIYAAELASSTKNLSASADAFRPFELLGTWTLFADPVRDIGLLDFPQAGILRDCVLCTSYDGTIGVISMKEMDQ